MHLYDFYHRDLRRKNICFIKTNLLYIKIFNKKNPTYGYIFSLIDYGCVISNKLTYRMDIFTPLKIC